MTMVVEGPDKLVPDISATSNASTGMGSVMTMIHKYYAKKGETEVGPCWQCPNTTVYEFVSAYSFATETWEPDAPESPTEWADNGGREGCSSTDNAGFCWANPYIFDRKLYVDPGLDWANSVGTTVMRVKHWVAIRVPRCGTTPRYVIEGPVVMDLKVVAGSKVQWVRIN